jgi:hypothetical protein
MELATRLMTNAVSDALSRQLLAHRAGITHGGERNMWKVLGYQDEIKFKDYYRRYRRQDISKTIVDAPAQTTWRRPPRVFEPGTEDEKQAAGQKGNFETAFEDLAKRLRLWHYMERVDRLAGIGNYAVMLIGSQKGTDLEAPLSEDGISGADDIQFLSVFRQENADIDSLESDPTEPRFGLPAMYEIQFGVAKSAGGSGIGRSKRKVHHSRILHVADDLLEDDVNGTPRLEDVWNLLDDLLKIGGGSAEMFWNMVGGIWHLNIKGDVDVDPADLKLLDEKVQEAIQSGIRRFVQTREAELTMVGGDTPDPRGVFFVIKSLISAAKQIPQRILFGAEAGELASSMDEKNWLGRIRERQESFAEPQMLRPFVDRLQVVGALPEAKEYEVDWPPLSELDEKDLAEVMKAKADAWKALAEALVLGVPASIEEAREQVLALDPNLPEGMIEMGEFMVEKPPALIPAPDGGDGGPPTSRDAQESTADAAA